MSIRFFSLSLSALVALSACDKSTVARTQVMLEIDADQSVRDRLETLRLVFDVSDDDGKSWQHGASDSYDSKRVGGWDRFHWPARLGLVPDRGHDARRFAVRVQALDANDELYVWQSAAAGFKPQHTTVLRIDLSAACGVGAGSCGDPACIGTQTCMTCRSGECVAVEIMSLPEFDPKTRRDAGVDAGESDAASLAPDAAPGADADVAGHAGSVAGEAGMEASTSMERDSGSARDANAPEDSAVHDSGAVVDTSFRVTAIAPSGVLDDTHAHLQIDFSADVAKASVNSSSVAVTRDGQAVPGTLATTANSVSFTPTAAWALGASYALALDSSVKDIDHRTLTPASEDFSIRDGNWSHEKRAEISGVSNPIVVMAKDGYALLVWSDAALGMNMYERVLSSRFTPPASWGAVDTIEAGGAAGLTGAIVNAQHHAAVTWSSISSNVELNSYTSGPDWSSGVYLSQTSYNPFLLLGDDDRLVVVCDTPTKGSASTVVGFDSTLPPQSPSAVDVGGTASGNSSAQAALFDHNLLVVFQHTPSGGSDSQIMQDTLSTASGVALSASGVNAIEPKLVANGPQTSAIVAWTQSDANTNVWAARIASGGNWSAPARLSDDTSPASKPQLAIDDLGRGLAVFAQNGKIVSASFAPASGWGSASTISDAGVISADPPVLAMEPGGNALAAWTQDGVDMHLNEIWVARYIADQGWQPAARARISDADASADSIISLAIDASGRAFAAWYQSNQIWVARFE